MSTFKHWRWCQLHFFGEIWSPSSLYKWPIFIFILFMILYIFLLIYTSLFLFSITIYIFSIVLFQYSKLVYSICNNTLSQWFWESTAQIFPLHSTHSTLRLKCRFCQMLQKMDSVSFNDPWRLTFFLYFSFIQNNVLNFITQLSFLPICISNWLS